MTSSTRKMRSAAIWGVCVGTMGMFAGGLVGAVAYMAIYAYADSQYLFGAHADVAKFALFVLGGMALFGIIATCVGAAIGAARRHPQQESRQIALQWTGGEWLTWDGASWVGTTT